MGIRGQCALLAAFALLSVALAGCMQTENYLQPPGLTSGCPFCQGPNGAQAGGVPVNAPGNAMPGNAMPVGGMPSTQPAGTRAFGDTEVVQTAYRPFGGPGDPQFVGGPPIDGSPAAGVATPGAPIAGAPIAGAPVNGPMADPAATGPPGPYPCPREVQMQSHPPYTVAPPDVLLINILRAVPKGPYRLEPLETLQIVVTNTLPNQPISGPYVISPEGSLSLGYGYGTVRVGGLTLAEAEVAIRRHLSSIVREPNVTLSLVQFRGIQQVAGQHLVRPDGSISLGSYGSVYVAGMTLGQVKCEVEKYLSAYLVNPQVSVDMMSYNSKKYYVIFDGAGYGQLVYALPATGNETVLDAISRVGGLNPVSSLHRIFLARPSPCEMGCNQILPVDWQAILMGSTCTNYQVFPGDRIYVDSNWLIRLDNRMAQVLAPVERVLGITLLGAATVNTIRGTSTGTGFIVR